MAAHWTAGNLTEKALRGAVDALVAQGDLSGRSNAHRQEAIAAFLAGDTSRRRENKGGGCNRYWARPNGPLITRVLAHLNAGGAGASLAEADPDLNQNTQHHTTTNMLAMQSAQTKVIVDQLGALVQEHIAGGELEASAWDHLVEAAIHTAAMHWPEFFEHRLPETASSSSADPAPPSQSEAHRAAKAPKARTTTYFRRQRVGGDKPPRSKGKTVAAPPPTAAERPSKAIRKRRPKAQKKKRPLSGYNLFCGAKTRQIQEEHPDMVFTERGRMAARDWNELPPDDKEAWKAKAVVVNARAKAAEEARRAAIEDAEGEYDEAVDRDYEEEEGEEEEEEEDSEDEESGEEEDDE